MTIIIIIIIIIIICFRLKLDFVAVSIVHSIVDLFVFSFFNKTSLINRTQIQ